MRNNFIRWWNILIQLLISFGLLYITCIIVIISCVAKHNFKISIIFLIALAIFIVLGWLILLMLSNRLLTKVQISKNGIKCILLKQKNEMFSWDEIIDIKKIYIAKTQSIFLETKDRTFDFNVNKKIMNALVYYCTNDAITIKMKEIELVF